jgi:Lon protease-like protein
MDERPPITRRFPLFPLHAVLLPSTTLPLHIFEPRYRELVGRCLEHDETFGIVYILEGDEVGSGATPRSTGTEAAVIASRRHPDGRYDIVVEGRRRFEVLRLDRSRSLLRADVGFLPEPLGPDAEASARAVEALLEGMESLAGKGHPIIDETWHGLDPNALSYRVASILPIRDEVRQGLLEAPDATARLRQEARLLLSGRRIGARHGAAGRPTA